MTVLLRKLFLFFAATLLLAITPARADDPTPVTTRPLVEVAVFPAHNAPAAAISLNDTQVSAEISAVIQDIPVRVGDAVAQGDVLVSLACLDYEVEWQQAIAAHEQAQSKLSFFRSQLTSARALSKNKSISKEALDERKSNQAAGLAEVERLEALVKRARLRVEKCRVRAPFDAVVVERLASVGELATPGTRLARILDSENIEIEADVQEADLDSLEGAESLRFASNRKDYPVRLRAVLPMIDSQIRSFKVRLEFVAERAPPGSVGRLVWKDVDAHLPPNLLVTRNQQLGVFVDEAGAAKFLPLNGAHEGRFTRIDLSPDTVIIVEGRHSLQNGDPVSAVQ